MTAFLNLLLARLAAAAYGRTLRRPAGISARLAPVWASPIIERTAD